MIVCSCTGATDRTIREVVRERTCSLADVVRACRAGGACGGCVGLIEQLVRASASDDRTNERSNELVAAV